VNNSTNSCGQQTTTDNNRQQQTTTDNNRQQQTTTDNNSNNSNISNISIVHTPSEATIKILLLLALFFANNGIGEET